MVNLFSDSSNEITVDLWYYSFLTFSCGVVWEVREFALQIILAVMLGILTVLFYHVGILKKICEAHQSVHDYCIDFSNSSDDVFVIELLIDESKLLHVQCSADIAVHRRCLVINVGSVYSCRCAVHQQQLLLVNVLLAPRLLASQSSAPKWREGFLRQNFSSMMHVWNVWNVR